jgi:hypothetical protein
LHLSTKVFSDHDDDGGGGGGRGNNITAVVLYSKTYVLHSSIFGGLAAVPTGSGHLPPIGKKLLLAVFWRLFL